MKIFDVIKYDLYTIKLKYNYINKYDHTSR